MGCRRTIRKPAGLSDADTGKLADALRDAVAQQKELAAWSPHVLRFLGDLEETEDGSAFVIEHEPAVVFPNQNPFDPSLPPVEQEQLFGLSAALMHALYTVHRSKREGANAHGGLCPGVVMLSADKIVKLTDFGFASACCHILGAESYLNLAVSSGDGSTSTAKPLTSVSEDSSPQLALDPEVTGAWEILPAHQFDRHDRICAFIDPQKYRLGAMEGFEPGSDLIAAAFLLYLWSEHHHPYLQDYPDAHRLPDMCEFMTQLVYRTYGQSYRDSEDEKVKRWAELLDGMLARLPKDRPSAAEVCLALAEAGITPDSSAKLPTPTDVAAQKEQAVKPKKRTKAFAAIAAVVVMAGVGVVMGLRSRGGDAPDSSQPGVAMQAVDDPGLVDVPQDTPTVSPLAAARDQLRAIIAEYPALAGSVDRMVPEPDAGDPDPPGVTYHLAGMPQTKYVLIPDGTDDEGLLIMSEQQIQQLRAALAQLDGILTTATEPTELIATLSAVLDDESYVALLDRTRIRLRFDTAPDWRISRGLDRWTAADVTTRIALVSAPDQAGVSTETDLVTVQLNLRATQGQLSAGRLGDALETSMRQGIGAKLLELQNASLQQALGKLTQDTATMAPQITAQPATLQDTRSSAALTVAVAGLVPRGFSLTWSPADIRFDFAPEAEQRIAELLLAHGALAAFNSKLAEDHWIREVSQGDAFEASPPVDGTWTLAVPALWAPTDVPPDQRDPADLLPIPVEWPEGALDAAALADQALAADAPPYWALFDDYRRYQQDPFFLVTIIQQTEPAATDLAVQPAANGDSLVAYLTSNPPPKYLLPRTQLSGKPQLRSPAAGETPTALDLPVQAGWALVEAPAGTDRDALALAVDSLPALTGLSVTLRLATDGGVQLSGVQALVEAFESTQPAAVALADRLDRLPVRAALDVEFQQRLPQGTDQIAITGDVLDVLRKIWLAKGAPQRPELARLEDLSAALRGRNGLRFDKAQGARRDAILPTIFIEYFCGPQFCYAVTWSAGNDTINAVDNFTVDQPTLLRLCPSAEVLSAVVGDAANLGDRLFTPVLAAVSTAVEVAAAEYFPSFHLGLVLAFDGPLWLLTDVESVGFASQETSLRDIRRTDSMESTKRWATLGELRAGTSSSDFALIRSLSASLPPTEPAAGEKAAIRALIQATAPTP